MQQAIFKPDRTAKVLVVGDIILDQYIYGETSRISPEAPVPVVKVTGTEERPGGAANVAVNVAALGVSVALLGMTGKDEAADRLESLLSEQGVECHFIRHDDCHTISKRRVLSQHQQLLRLDYEKEKSTLDYARLMQHYEELLNDTDVIILSDYAKGSLKNISDLIDAANRLNKPVLVDPKSTDFSIYSNSSLLTPNLKELQAVVGPVTTTEEIVAKGRALCEQLKLGALLVTRGEKGMTLLQQDAEVLHLKAQTHEVYDVTGAGDTVIATLAAGLACRYALPQATAWSNIAAGMVVEKLGAATVTAEEINSYQGSVKHNLGVLDQQEAVRELQLAQRKGEQIVMTNGCFDILHAGHIAYLEKARTLGDKLVVAVNSDASVTKLKGPSRPVNPLPNRMKILAALACVDIVVAFEADTPEQLIKQLSPDILVKGGDYTEEQIAGAEHVRANGGEVVVLPFEEGQSTSLIVDKIKNHNEAEA